MMTIWPSGLRRWLQAPVRKGVGSNPTAVTGKIWGDGDKCGGGGEGEKEGAGRGEEESHRRSYIPQAQKKWLETIGN